MFLNWYGFLVGDGGKVLEMDSGDRRTIMYFLICFEFINLFSQWFFVVLVLNLCFVVFYV